MNTPSWPTRIRAAVKSLLLGDPAASPWYLGDALGPVAYSTGIDYRTEAGALDANAIVMACVNWVTTTFPAAPIRVQRTTGTQTLPVPGHALTRLIAQPNPYYTGLDLWAATLVDYNISGNAYWLLNRGSGGRGKPVELWYEPHFSIRTRGSADAFISAYQVYRGGAWLDVDPRDVIHFRHGIDPSNQRLGISRLLAAYREIYTDNEAARWSAVLLRNTGIPGVVISPRGTDVLANPEAIKAAFTQKFIGDRRGDPLVLTKPTDVYKLDWSPAEMDLTALRRLPEERVSGLIGVPAVLAGLGAGLDRSTYSNMDQAREQGWYDNILPTQDVFAAVLNHRLLPEVGDPATESAYFDTSRVRALQEDQNALYTRLTTAYDSGWLRRDEARSATGRPAAEDGSDAVYKPGPAPLLPALSAPAPKGFKALAVPGLPGPPAATEARFQADVAGVLDRLWRQAAAEHAPAPVGASRNGHREDN